MRGHRVQNKYTINFDKKIQGSDAAKASPLWERCLRQTEEKPGTKEHLHSDKHSFDRVILSLCFCFASAIPSVGDCQASSYKGGALGRPGPPVDGNRAAQRRVSEGSRMTSAALLSRRWEPQPFPRYCASHSRRNDGSQRLPFGESPEGDSISTTYNENMNKNSKKPYRSRFRSAIIFYACYKNLK